MPSRLTCTEYDPAVISSVLLPSTTMTAADPGTKGNGVASTDDTVTGEPLAHDVKGMLVLATRHTQNNRRRTAIFIMIYTY